jgi:hypothetical protein
MKLDAQHASEIDLGKRDVVCPKSGVQTATSCPVSVEPTGRKFAERDEHQSGQRFLNGSAPRLRRHVAFCETAAGDVASPTAGKDEKPFREFEGGALISAEGAVPFRSDSDEISKLAEFFLLLDRWDRRRNDSPIM